MLFRRLLPLLLVAALVAAACSGGDSDDESSDATEAPAETAAPSDTQAPLSGSNSGDGGSSSSGSDFGGLTGDGVARARLTGQELDGVARSYIPAVAVKIDNVDAARPQSGINQADIVVEELVEGGITRFFAVFQSQLPDEIGPVRSARSTDVPLLQELGQPLFSWSGANDAFAQLIRSLNIVDVGFEAAPDAYVRSDERSAPSNLYASGPALLEAGIGDGVTPPPPFVISSDADLSFLSGTGESAVTIDFGGTEVRYEWDAGEGGWLRSTNGEPHVDADGEQVAPTNVIVRFVTYGDSGAVDSSGSVVPEANLRGAGRAWYLVDGEVYEGQWDDAGLGRPRYISNGIFVPFRPGTTWIALAPEGSATLG